jgi:hypothetical protein
MRGFAQPTMPNKLVFSNNNSSLCPRPPKASMAGSSDSACLFQHCKENLYFDYATGQRIGCYCGF